MILISHYLSTYIQKEDMILDFEDEEKYLENKIDVYDALLHKSDKQFLKI